MVQDIVTGITDAIKGMLMGLGSAIVDFFNKVVLTAEGELTTYAIWALAFIGVGIAMAIVGFVISKARA